MSVSEKQILQILLDAIKARWGKKPIPKELQLLKALAEEKLKEGE
jgi:cytochrome c551/c552